MTLTGRVGAGRAVAAQAGAVGKKVVLELGGSDPFIVLPSADLDRAVPVAVQARVQNGGQSCIAAKRFIVHADVADAFTERFVAGMDALSVGDPFDPATEVGPAGHCRRRGRHRGPGRGRPGQGGDHPLRWRADRGPEWPDRPGFFYRPDGDHRHHPGMRVATEEVFGPVALLYTVADADEALHLANDTEFGLGSSVWTNDPDEQQQFVNGFAGRPGVRQRDGRVDVRAALRRHQEFGIRARARLLRPP